MITENEFKIILLGLADYYSKQLTESLIQIYWRKLSHLTHDELITATDKWIEDMGFFPKVHEIIERVPERPRLQHKGSIEYCDNTRKLMEKYPPKNDFFNKGAA